jgi:hypothetical protein
VAVANLVNMLLGGAQQPEVGRPSSLTGRKGLSGARSGLTAGDGEGKRIRELCATALEVRKHLVRPAVHTVSCVLLLWIGLPIRGSKRAGPRCGGHVRRLERGVPQSQGNREGVYLSAYTE